jgi:hypothetical protein
MKIAVPSVNILNKKVSYIKHGKDAAGVYSI